MFHLEQTKTNPLSIEAWWNRARKAEYIGTICPTCGRANACQIASSRKCSCFDMPVEKVKIERALRSKSQDQCLCKDCLNKLSV